MDEIQQLLQEVKQLIDNKEYEAADKKLSDDVLERYNYADLYAQKARICNRLKKYKTAIVYAEKALSLDSSIAFTYALLGHIYTELEDYNTAEEHYYKAQELDPKFVHTYNGLGILYAEKKEYRKARENFQKALELDPNYEHAYNNWGNVCRNEKDYGKSEENYKKALEINPHYANAHYNLGLNYEDMGDLEKAITSFERWLETPKDVDYSDIKYIEDKIEELKKQLKDDAYFNVSKLVVQIKELLQYNGKSITHYTSLSVTRLLVLEEKPIRISEGGFLNDTSEGTALFDFLNIDTEHGTHNKSSHNHISFVKKPFIGSYVADSKCNDLTLWRMYGKENNEEAKGCAITVDAAIFLEHVKQDLLPSSDGETQSIEDDFRLYHVAYISNNNDFIVPNNKTASNKLRRLLIRIRTYIKNFLEKQPSPKKQDDMRELLNRIAYLFKNAEYQYEHEVRLIVRDVRLKREIETKDEKKEPLKLPRVFINLININPYINKITIGPKVANKEEWASIFYYHLQEKQTNKNLEIQVSCLPFK